MPGKRTLSDFNFGKRRTARRNYKPKMKCNISVSRVHGAKKARWLIKVLLHPEYPTGEHELQSVMLPGDFITMHVANRTANALAVSYRDSGYEVALKTAKRQSQQQTRRS